jgi:hypothetical protein
MMRANRLTTAVVAAAMLAIIGVAPAGAAPRLEVEVGDVGTIVDAGAAVVITLTVQCPRAGFEVLEAHASASQGGASGMGGFSPRCGGRDRTYEVRVASFGEPFVAGSAMAGGFVLMLGRDGGTISSSDSETITLQ